jgi:hypothetical protein
VSRLMSYATWRSYTWMAASGGVVALYIWQVLTHGDRVSRKLFENQLDAWWDSMTRDYGLGGIDMLLAMYGRLNLVMIGCADSILHHSVHIWRDDAADGEALKAQRDAECAEVLALFEYDAPSSSPSRRSQLVASSRARIASTVCAAEHITDEAL